MDELVEDPLVLEAALALVDEWCTDAEKGDKENCQHTRDAAFVASVTAMSPHGLRKRTREEMAWLRSSVQHLHDHASAKRLPQRRRIQVSSDESTGESGDDEPCAVVVSPDRRGTQARRLLEAIEAYNRVRAATDISFGSRDVRLIYTVNDERIVATLRSRLDALTEILEANQVANLHKVVVDESPVLTGVGFRARALFSFLLPFKLSIVESVMWEMSSENNGEGRLTVETPNEQLCMAEVQRETPFGLLASTGPGALRRVFQADGSVAHIYTSVRSGPTRPASDRDSPNLLAGCVMKQAGWARIGRAPERSDVRSDRSLVLVECSQSIVVEALPGRSVSKDQFLRIWEAILSPSVQDKSSGRTLENRLMDRQLATQGKGIVPR